MTLRNRIPPRLLQRVIRLSDAVRRRALETSLAEFGPESWILQPAWIHPAEKCRIGARTGINPFTAIHAWGGVTIGSDVLISTNCTITSSGHPLDRAHRSSGALDLGPVHIGDGAWIGANVVVLSGVTIGEGAVIGAGAVVTKDVPDYAILVGVPGRVVGSARGDGSATAATVPETAGLA